MRTTTLTYRADFSMTLRHYSAFASSDMSHDRMSN